MFGKPEFSPSFARLHFQSRPLDSTRARPRTSIFAFAGLECAHKSSRCTLDERHVMRLRARSVCLTNTDTLTILLKSQQTFSYLAYAVSPFGNSLWHGLHFSVQRGFTAIQVDQPGPHQSIKHPEQRYWTYLLKIPLHIRFASSLLWSKDEHICGRFHRTKWIFPQLSSARFPQANHALFDGAHPRLIWPRHAVGAR